MSEGMCDIQLVQALCIMVYWKSPTDNTAFLKIGHAIRMAYQLNLHLPKRSSLPTDIVEAKSFMVSPDLCRPATVTRSILRYLHLFIG